MLKSKYKEKNSEVEGNVLNKAGYSADISFDIGFDDDSGGSPFIYTRINNGKKLTIAWYNDENCDGEDLNGVEFYLMGKPNHYDPEYISYDDAVNFILNNGGKITHELTETTKYAICPWRAYIKNLWSGTPDNSVEKLWDQGVPVLTESGFVLRWGELLIEDYWNIDFNNPETNYRDWFADNGLGNIETHYWEDGKWVRCKNKAVDGIV